MTKAEIRALAQHLKLPVWDKPTLACLASRFPYGSQITPEKLAQVEAAENLLWDLGFRQYRVRRHDETARIPAASFPWSAPIWPGWARPLPAATPPLTLF